MRNSKKKKNRKLGHLFIRIIILTLLTTSIIAASLSHSSRASIESESNSLLLEISTVNKDNATLKHKNETLIDTIKKNESLYSKSLTNAKIAYLTFDDGPSANTPAILAILKKYDIKATFFVNGHSSLSDLYKQISDDGHALANHTYSHDYKLVYSSVDNFKKDVKKLDAFIKETTGAEPNHVLRYPGGSNNHISRSYGGVAVMNSILKEMNNEGYVYFDWNVDSTDASVFRQTKDNIVQAVLNQSSSVKNPIILMHDLNPKTTTPEALPEIIEGLINKGFSFDVLSKDTPATQFRVAK